MKFKDSFLNPKIMHYSLVIKNYKQQKLKAWR